MNAWREVCTSGCSKKETLDSPKYSITIQTTESIRVRNASVITEKSYKVELIKKVIEKNNKVLKTKEKEAESTFSLEQPVEEDMRDESAISQKEKHENTTLTRRLLQWRSNTIRCYYHDEMLSLWIS